MIAKAMHILAFLTGVSSIVLAGVWFGWELALIIFLCHWSRNLSRRAIYEKIKEETEKAIYESENIDPRQ